MVLARKTARITQAALAETLGRPQIVRREEGGERRLNVAEFVGVAKALGADPYKMLRTADKAR